MNHMEPSRRAHARVAGLLDALGESPPQSLLLEGGTAEERLRLALSYTARLNCGQAGPQGASPCLECHACRAIEAGVFRDMKLLDGTREAVKIADVRELKVLMGEPPRGEGTRVIILAEAQGLTTAAANCLLKSMEEPRPGNVFVLTAPMRERLLPTLVSRSMALTLAWATAEGGNQPAGAEELAGTMSGFWVRGTGWHERGRDRLEQHLAAGVLAALQGELCRAYTGAGVLSGVPPAGLDRLSSAVDEAGHAVGLQVSPGLVLDWLAVAGRRAPALR